MVQNLIHSVDHINDDFSMTVKLLTPKNISEFKKLVEIFNLVFENKRDLPDDDCFEKLLQNKDFMVFVVLVNDTVVGGATIYILHQYYNSKPLAYIYDVGIDPTFQGQGMGKALIATICDYCKNAGFEAAFVQAEMEDVDAVRFYEATNYDHRLQSLQYTYHFDHKP